MTSRQRAVTRYASPSLRKQGTGWAVTAHPWGTHVGTIAERASGWTAVTDRGAYAGLWPTKQAAAEVLVQQAGFEVEQ